MLTSGLSKQYENMTRRYYGADTDPFKLVPVVKNREVAHTIALQVDRDLQRISKTDFVKDALRAQAANRFSRGETDLSVLTEQARGHALNMIVVNAELTHARLAPEDFNEDAQQSGAYEMSSVTALLPPVNPDDLRQ